MTGSSQAMSASSSCMQASISRIATTSGASTVTADKSRCRLSPRGRLLPTGHLALLLLLCHGSVPHGQVVLVAAPCGVWVSRTGITTSGRWSSLLLL